MRSLNKLLWIRRMILPARRWLLRRKGAEIHPSASVSLSARLIGGQPGAIAIGAETLVAFKTLLLAREPDGRVRPIRIGRHCFIGGGSAIMPGVCVGDESIVAAGSVVLADVPPRCIVGGNPARILRTGIEVGAFGRLPVAGENSRRFHEAD